MKIKNTIEDLDSTYLQDILDQSKTLADVILKIGLSLHGNNYVQLNKTVKNKNLSLEQLNKNRKQSSFGGVKEIPIEDVLIKDSSYNRGSLKLRLVKEGLLDYKCSVCENTGMWNNQKLTLQLDHMNGINTDNRLENLRFICPNCHSQTDTYTGKNSKRIKFQNRCVDCNCNIFKTSTRCMKCEAINNPRKLKFEVSKEELQALINKHPMTTIGKMFNVSSTAIKKRCEKFNITKS